MSVETTKIAAELALAAKRRRVGSTQLTGEALELFLNKKVFELEDIVRGEKDTIEVFSPQQE